MPTATDDLRQWAIERFGSIDLFAPIEWLKAQGFELLESFSWVPPNGGDSISDDEWKAIDFLMQEWDFEGVVF